MINLPFLCNIEVPRTTSREVRILSIDTPQRLRHSLLDEPNAVVDKEKVLTYSGLNFTDSLSLENTLKGTKGIERISYEGKKYRLRKYIANYGHNLVKLTLYLEQVA
jgi:hypothetical protein